MCEALTREVNGVNM